MGPGLAPDSRALPPQLAARRMKERDWLDLMKLLDKDVQSKRWTDCQGWAVGCTLVGIPWLCSACAAYQSAAREWLDRLYADMLEPRGLFAKFQTRQTSLPSMAPMGWWGQWRNYTVLLWLVRWRRGWLEHQSTFCFARPCRV